MLLLHLRRCVVQERHRISYKQALLDIFPGASSGCHCLVCGLQLISYFVLSCLRFYKTVKVSSGL